MRILPQPALLLSLFAERSRGSAKRDPGAPGLLLCVGNALFGQRGGDNYGLRTAEHGSVTVRRTGNSSAFG
jgi:hypothetical protein